MVYRRIKLKKLCHCLWPVIIQIQEQNFMNIKTLIIKCNNIGDTAAFYRRILNADPMFVSASILKFQAGESVLIFEQTDIPAPIYHFAFDLPCNLLHNAFEYIGDRATVLRVNADQYYADFTNWNAKSFYFLDNNGNILEYICRYDKNIEHTGPFNGRQLISISEAGLPAENALQLMAKLMYRYPLTPYEKQPPLEHFAALGDVNGLFILSGIGRAWYPTQVPAAVFPIKVIFEEKGVSFEHEL